MNTYLIQTTLPSMVRVRAEEFQFNAKDGILYFTVEGRRVAAFPVEAVVGVAEKPFGLDQVSQPDWSEGIEGIEDEQD